MLINPPRSCHTIRTLKNSVQYGDRLQESVSLPDIMNVAYSSSQVIYGQNHQFSKAKGYESQSFERKHAALFNCRKPDWVSTKKNLIAPALASKHVLNHHAEAIATHSERLLEIVGGGQPCDMSTIGKCSIAWKTASADSIKLSASVWMSSRILYSVLHWIFS